MATNSAGIRVTQIGVSDIYAADYQYVFNSDWPSLAIAFEANLSVSAGSIGEVAHGLKFYPLTMAWFMVNGVSVGRFYGDTLFDKENVYIDNTLNSSDVVASIKCYNLDISVPVDYTLPKFPLVSRPYDPTTGIKVTKHGKAMSSTDLRDYILHSRAQSPAVLSINTVNRIYPGSEFAGEHIEYTNPANYTPWVLGFAMKGSDPTKYKAFPPGGNQSFPAFVQIGATSYILPANTGTGDLTDGSLVVLRDPLIAPNTKEVIY